MNRRPLVALFAVAGLTACDTTYDNRAACEAFLRTQSCGTVDFTEFLDCSSYETENTCDLNPFFDCLGENGACDTTVDPAVFDDAGWATCATKGSCL